jgi:hypothetical protein
MCQWPGLGQADPYPICEESMQPIYVSSLVFVVVFSGAALGMLLRRVLPQEHFTQEARTVVSLSTGFVVTMTGLVLGMLVSSAKSSYDAQRVRVEQVSSRIILLNRTLVEYGPEADPIRSQMYSLVQATLHRVWPREEFKSGQVQPTDYLDKIEQQLRFLAPANDHQAAVRIKAIAVLDDLREVSWLVFIETESNSLPTPLLVVLVLWLVAIFVSFGLVAPPNPSVIVTLSISALAVSSAILIILEMYTPFSGILRISSAPIRDVLNQIQH